MNRVPQVCTRCVMDAAVAGLTFDADGICSHCRIHDKLDHLYPTGEQGQSEMEAIAEKIKKDGQGKQYDCIVGISGGRDTSYCLHMTKELGLRPLAVHFDNGWDADVAKNNLRKLCTKMDIDLHTVISDWVESRELTNCTLRACVPYIDMTDDVGIARSLYETAENEGVGYIILSHSFREEGINPLAWNYFDGRYYRALVKRFARIPIKKRKNLDIHHLLYWMFYKRIRLINLTNYYNDAGQHVEQLLAEKYGWYDTQQHHYDNEMFALVSHYSRKKFGFDWWRVDLAAKVRTGVIERETALAKLKCPPAFESKENVEYCLKKQGISPAEWNEIMAAPCKYFWDYPNYYTYLKLFKYPIKWLGRLNILPSYVYEKYFET